MLKRAGEAKKENLDPFPSEAQRFQSIATVEIRRLGVLHGGVRVLRRMLSVPLLVTEE